MLSNQAKFNEVRQLIANNSINDYSELFRLLYDEVDSYAKNNVPECIIAVAEGQYNDVHVVDKEINFMSTIMKIQERIK